MNVDLDPSPVILRSGSAECEIWPHAGGSIARWAIGNQQMFRPLSTATSDGISPLDMASFPLVPYSNRIGFGRFAFGGNAIELEPNFAPEPHAIHGIGWTAEWETIFATDSEIALRLKHQSDTHWPWSFEAQQRITLSYDRLTIEMSVRNLSDQVVPLAFGHHPYFECEGAALWFDAEHVWFSGEHGLPSHAAAPCGVFDFEKGGRVQGRILDNGFAGWDGKAMISWDDRPLNLEIVANMQAAVVYIPKDGDYFCFEPVPHIINALNLPDHEPQMPMVEPHAIFESHIHFITYPRPSDL